MVGLIGGIQLGEEIIGENREAKVYQKKGDLSVIKFLSSENQHLHK